MVEEGYRAWDDGAAYPLTVNQASGQAVLIGGPVVLLGWSLLNGGGAATVITFYDGLDQFVYAFQLGANTHNNNNLPDRGIKFLTDLQMALSAAEQVTGALWIRKPERMVDGQ